MVAADPKKKNNSTMINVLIALCLALVIIGALNWGTTAFGYNLVEMVAGKDTTFSKGVYSLVAVGAVGVLIFLLTKKLKLNCDCGVTSA